VAPGTTVGSRAILSMGSIATGNLVENGIYQGNPADLVRMREGA
jgi:acetyltransferase-like isoleucine patch superfamily enzyme